MKLNGLKAVILCGLVSACASSEPQVNPTAQLSTDPILLGVFATFQDACIANAPSFREDAVRPAFRRSEPTLAPGMFFLASWQFERRCGVTIRNYGKDRPKPTVGDINALARAVQARLGGTFEPKRPDLVGGARVRSESGNFRVVGYVGNGGDLSISMSK